MASANITLGHEQDRAGLLLAIAWTEVAISSVFITFRFYCRKKITKNLWWDDWFILITFVFALISSSMFTGYACNGGTKHISDLRPGQIPKERMFNYLSQGSCILALSTGKISVALLIYRLQAPCRWRTWLLAFLSVSSFVMAIVVIALSLKQCSSVQALLHPNTGACWNHKVRNDWIISAYSYWATVDFIFALLPLTFLWKLQMKTKKKVLLCVLLGLGVFASVCAAIKAYYLATSIDRVDSTWRNVLLLIWNSNEVNVVIYAACIPTVIPIFTRSSMNISRWAIFRTRHPKSNTSDKVRGLGSIDDAPQSKRTSLCSTLADDWTKSDGHIDKTHILGLDFTGQSGDLQDSIEKKIRYLNLEDENGKKSQFALHGV